MYEINFNLEFAFYIIYHKYTECACYINDYLKGAIYEACRFDD